MGQHKDSYSVKKDDEMPSIDGRMKAARRMRSAARQRVRSIGPPMNQAQQAGRR